MAVYTPYGRSIHRRLVGVRLCCWKLGLCHQSCQVGKFAEAHKQVGLPAADLICGAVRFGKFLGGSADCIVLRPGLDGKHGLTILLHLPPHRKSCGVRHNLESGDACGIKLLQGLLCSVALAGATLAGATLACLRLLVSACNAGEHESDCLACGFSVGVGTLHQDLFIDPAGFLALVIQLPESLGSVAFALGVEPVCDGSVQVGKCLVDCLLDEGFPCLLSLDGRLRFRLALGRCLGKLVGKLGVFGFGCHRPCIGRFQRLTHFRHHSHHSFHLGFHLVFGHLGCGCLLGCCHHRLLSARWGC